MKMKCIKKVHNISYIHIDDNVDFRLSIDILDIFENLNLTFIKCLLHII